jgi:hypothetical protein
MNKKTIIGLLLSALLILVITAQADDSPLNEITTHAVSQKTGSFDVSDFPPVIDAVSQYDAEAGDLVTINATAYDPNGNNVTIAYGLPLNSSGQWQTAINEAGIYYANITASDGTQQTVHTVTIRIIGGCGDGICYSNESCSSCAADCGTCTPGRGGGGGGGGAPPKEEPCVPDWQCYSWGVCENNHQNRECFDANMCNDDSGKPPLERVCVAGCAERWSCGEWGACMESGTRMRVCNDLAKCGTTKRKPETEQTCEYDHCKDGRMNIDETGVDCGGSCKPCAKEETKKITEEVRDLVTGVATILTPSKQPNLLYLLLLLLVACLITNLIISRHRKRKKMLGVPLPDETVEQEVTVVEEKQPKKKKAVRKAKKKGVKKVKKEAGKKNAVKRVKRRGSHKK